MRTISIFGFDAPSADARACSRCEKVICSVECRIEESNRWFLRIVAKVESPRLESRQKCTLLKGRFDSFLTTPG